MNPLTWLRRSGPIRHWHHPMQKRLGGIWELFIPCVNKGDLYKYEIRTQEGHCYQKADPYGFQHEVRPAQSSVITNLDGFQWEDEDWMSKRDSSSIDIDNALV